MVNIFFVGDELVAGYGDARALGWTGRVLARTSNEPPLMPLTLAIPGENTDSLAKRWAEEVGRRIHPEEDNRLVLGLGSHDLDSGQTLARARLHLANTLDAALRLRLRSFVVGPPPRRDVPRKIQEDLTRAFADVCARRDLPYVDTFTPLVDHEQWNTDMSVSGGYEPGTGSSPGWSCTTAGTNGWASHRSARPDRPHSRDADGDAIERRPRETIASRPCETGPDLPIRACGPQALGRLPWLAGFPARERRLRPRRLMAILLRLCTPPRACGT